MMISREKSPLGPLQSKVYLVDSVAQKLLLPQEKIREGAGAVTTLHELEEVYHGGTRSNDFVRSGGTLDTAPLLRPSGIPSLLGQKKTECQLNGTAVD